MSLVKILELRVIHEGLDIALFDDNVVAWGKWNGTTFTPALSSADPTKMLAVKYPDAKTAAMKFFEQLMELRETFDGIAKTTVEEFQMKERAKEEILRRSKEFKENSNQQKISEVQDENEHGG